MTQKNASEDESTNILKHAKKATERAKMYFFSFRGGFRTGKLNVLRIPFSSKCIFHNTDNLSPQTNVTNIPQPTKLFKLKLPMEKKQWNT